MTAKRRTPKDGDFLETKKAYELVIELMDQHTDIEMCCWIDALWSLIASAYKNSSITAEQFQEEANNMIEKYKEWLERIKDKE